jgi:hypothetical protein
MILESVDIGNKLRIEIVEKDSIAESYANRKYVSSCLSHGRRPKYLKKFNYFKDLKLMRIMHEKDLLLRTLIWNVTDLEDNKQFKLLDRVYTCHTDEVCRGYKESGRPKPEEEIRQLFTRFWPKFADVRNTARKVCSEIIPNRVQYWPFLDTLCFIRGDKLYNFPEDYYEDSVNDKAIKSVLDIPYKGASAWW